MTISDDMTGIRAQCWAAMPGMQTHIMPILQYCMRMMMMMMVMMMRMMMRMMMIMIMMLKARHGDPHNAHPPISYCMRMMMVVMMTMMTWHGYDDFYIFVSLSEKISTTQSYPQDLQARSALNLMRRNIPDKREKSFLSVQFWNWCFSKFIWQPLLLEVAKQQHFTIYKWNKCDPRPFSGPSQY